MTKLLLKKMSESKLCNILLGLSMIISITFTFDELVFKRLAIIKSTTNARWFMIHAIMNFIVACLSFDDLVQTVLDPYNALDNCTLSAWPVYIVNSCHLYHCIIFFDKLTRDDWIHHVVFTGIIGGSGMLMLDDMGHLVNTCCFFLCTYGYSGCVKFVIDFLF